MPETCRHASCDATAKLVAHCDTGQEKYYCCGHGGGSKAGISRVEKWRAL